MALRHSSYPLCPFLTFSATSVSTRAMFCHRTLIQADVRRFEFHMRIMAMQRAMRLYCSAVH